MITRNKHVSCSNIKTFKTYNRFINRELSWLSFNERVLNEAKNKNYPILERLRFLSISGNNLDEFHIVRVAGIARQVKKRVKSISADGRTPKQQLVDVTNRLKSLLYQQQIMWEKLHSILIKKNIEVINREIDFQKNILEINEIFKTKIFPVLTPMAIDPAHPFPFLSNLSSTIILSLRDKEKKKINALITLPPRLEKFFKIIPDRDLFIKTKDIILLNIKKLFPSLELIGSTYIRVIRDSDIEFEEEAEDLMVSFEKALKKRRLGSVIGLYTEKNTDKKLLNFVKEKLNIDDSKLFEINSILEIESLAEIIEKSNSIELFKSFIPRFPKRITDHQGDCFQAIKKKDILIHHPFESFDVVIDFLDQAANDPSVISIKQTLYRTSKNSPIVKALIEAATNGKSVTAIVELKARFDEEKNIQWAKNLEKAGVQIVYGFFNWKTHAKISLISRKEGGTIQSYVHFGTGNYHPITAKIYTDLSYFSNNKDLCEDAGKIFNFITGYAKPENMKLVDFSPITLRKKLKDLIKKEINNKKKKLFSEICIKVNSLTDPEIIDDLYEASNAGVRIKLIVRGICSLKPGIKGLSENITVKSIIGRFLEHSRIYCFSNGFKMPSRKNKVFISSADLMTRNLERRVETFIPIMNKTIHEQILDQIVMSYIKDNVQSSELNSNGEYFKTRNDGESFSAHEFFMNNPSLSGRGVIEKKK
ncbi:RNA degradosome polyphosphate kinase [Rickettsiales bacterium]|nr:RNA degradosome polyphosphate kinase [Rickettsiales bacterium]